MSCILGLLDGKEGGKSNTYTHIYNINIQVKRRRLGCKGCRLAERIMQNGENLFRLSIVNGTSHLLRSNLYWLGFLDIVWGNHLKNVRSDMEGAYGGAWEEICRSLVLSRHITYAYSTSVVRLIGKYHYVYCCMHTLGVVKIRMH